MVQTKPATRKPRLDVLLEQKAKLDAALAQAEQDERERIGRLAAKAGLVGRVFTDKELLEGLRELAARFPARS